MKFNLTRRDVLKFAAGGAAGAMLTPMPWKALDDVAIWTQNWSWIPKPPKGPSTIQATRCALCPAGCPLQVRCVGGLPVSIRSATGAGLCPLGLTAHHLPYHPARLTRPVRLFHDGGVVTRRIPVPLDAAVTAASTAIRDARARSRTIAVLDMRPGRSVSWAWQRFLGGFPNAAYVAAPAGRRTPIDVDAVRTIVSFRRAIDEEHELRERILDSRIHLIQVDPVQTATAAIAATWLPARPGAEEAIAMALAGSMTPAQASVISGLPAETIASVARQVTQNGPAIAVGDQGLGHAADDAILELNAFLGNGSIPVTDLPAPFAGEPVAPVTALANVADGSLTFLLIDMSAGDVRFPWALVQRKLARGAVIVALSPFAAGTALKADYAVPTLPFLETVHELPSPADSSNQRLALSAAVMPPRHEAIDPVQFLRAVDRDLPGDWSRSEELMRARVARIHESGRGTAGEQNVKDFATADELWDALIAGNAWSAPADQSIELQEDRRGRLSSTRREQSDVARLPDRNGALELVIRTPADVSATAAVSPVMSKLYRESGLRHGANVVVVNPTTARQSGLRAGRRAKLTLHDRSLTVTIATDARVMPGVIEMTAGPDAVALGENKPTDATGILDLITPDADGAWRTVAARLVEA